MRTYEGNLLRVPHNQRHDLTASKNTFSVHIHTTANRNCKGLLTIHEASPQPAENILLLNLLRRLLVNFDIPGSPAVLMGKLPSENNRWTQMTWKSDRLISSLLANLVSSRGRKDWAERKIQAFRPVFLVPVLQTRTSFRSRSRKVNLLSHGEYPISDILVFDDVVWEINLEDFGIAGEWGQCDNNVIICPTRKCQRRSHLIQRILNDKSAALRIQ